MVFSSLTFLLLFLPIVIVIYFLMPNRTLKNMVLLLSSLVFYAWGEPVYIVLILISTVNDYTFARLVQKAKDLHQKKKSTVFFVLSIMVNLGLLGYFKYSGFIMENLNIIFDLNITISQLPLPIGISFYTFQTMSYSIDVYTGHVKAQKKFLPMATYVALFPQLIAGPIVRYITVEKELVHRSESLPLVAQGLRRFIIGLGKKVIIANQMGFIADTVFNQQTKGAGTLLIWLAIIAYSFQIYFDFSGYSDMAIGLGKIFGFHFLENFNYPYISKSITEFWRRWHISLGTWFRDYVYIPLGGNRVHAIRNIFIVWFLTGLWHGASWNYILWGLYYGLLLMFEKYILKGKLSKLPTVLQHIYTLALVLIGWTLFRLEDLSQLGSVLHTMFVYKETTIRTVLFTYQDMLYAIPFMIFAIIGSTPLFKHMYDRKSQQNEKQSSVFHFLADVYVSVILILSIIFLMGESFNPFIYFRF